MKLFKKRKKLTEEEKAKKLDIMKKMVLPYTALYTDHKPKKEVKK